jgi:hypothetical protein
LCALGALALGLSAAAVVAQSSDDAAKFPLRRTLAVTTTPVPAPSTNDTTPGTIQYLSPPGIGAGPTGFISTGTKRRARKTKSVTTRPAAPASLATVTTPSPETTAAIPPIRRPPRRLEEEDPFGSVGIPIGSLTLKSILDASAGYDTNALRTPGGPGSWFSVIAPQFLLKSNWARHELNAELRGTYTSYYDVSANNRPEAYANIRGRIDVTSLTRLELEGRAALTTESPGSPDAVTGVVRPPNVYAYGSTIGVMQRFNRFELALRGLIDRYVYESAALTSGVILDLSDRNYVAPGLRLRGSYELSAGIKPFVEIGVDRRVFDHEIDFSGIRRGSDGWFVRGGFAFERKGFLTGEISAGYMQRRYRDPSLPDISGLIFDSSLVWTATPLTRVTLSATSTVDETRVVGASGMFRHEGRIIVDHAFRRWLLGSLSVGYGIEDYRGSGLVDHRLRAIVSLTYYLNRMLALRGEFRHERLISDLLGQSYSANVMMLGLRLQR